MNVEAIVRALHIFGNMLWIGGVTAAGVVTLSNKSAEVAGAARKAILFVATPGIALSWIFGLVMLVPSFTEVYAHAGWMHAKLTFALIASGLHGAITARIRKRASGEAGGDTLVMVVVGVTLLAALVNVILVQWRPGS